MNIKEGDLVEVIWQDACTESENIEPAYAKTLNPIERKNTGYFLYQNEEKLIIYSGLITDTDRKKTACDYIYIFPTGMIQGIKKLE